MSHEDSVIYGDFFDQSPPETALVIADPPYGQIVSDDYDKVTEEDLVDFLHKFLHKCNDFVIEGGSVILWGGIGSRGNRPFLKFAAHLEEQHPEWEIRDIITWKKTRGYGVSDRYLFTREEFLWLVRGYKPLIFNKPYLDEEQSAATKGLLKKAKYKPHSTFKRRSNVWTDIHELMRGKIVSAQKPEPLYEVLVQTHSNKGDLIVDPFAGSFTTSVVAKKLGRYCWACEKDPDVFEIGRSRVEATSRITSLF